MRSGGVVARSPSCNHDLPNVGVPHVGRKPFHRPLPLLDKLFDNIRLLVDLLEEYGI